MDGVIERNIREGLLVKGDAPGESVRTRRVGASGDSGEGRVYPV